MHVFCYKKNAYKKVNLSTLKVKKVKKKFQTELKKTVLFYIEVVLKYDACLGY